MDEINSIKIRKASFDDLSSIVNIYNAIISEGGFTADLTPFISKTKKNWFLSLIENDNIFVLSDQSNVIGYFYLSSWREGRDALNTIAEVSFYIDKKYRGKGLGNRVLAETLTLAEKKGLKHLLAILLDINEASIGLLEKFGFEIVGHLPGIAKLKDRSCGQYLMLRNLSK